ncbi:MAG: 3-methylitaconate isomerase [Acidobacteria bacterium]|nr:3-methylitaconate isomerase [Acidobacteriota bacterium]
MPDVSIPCVLYRGGTSRGLLFLDERLPYPRDTVAAILLRAFGSPDLRQIDGIGGGTSLTSKALLVGRDRAPGADVHMLFAQVGVGAPTVDWGGNCGNMTSAVGPFAIDAGLVPAVEPVTVVRIRSVNTGVFVHAHVPVRGGRVWTEGDYAIPGVGGTSARIDLEWLAPGGSTTGRLLPTGRARDEFVLSDGARIGVSLVDAANPMVFCTAAALGLTGTEWPADIEARPVVMRQLEEIRSMAAEALGIVADRREATRVSPGLPKVACVAPAQAYQTTTGQALAAETHDLQGRYMSMQTAHRAYAGGGAICTGVAALLPGTVVHDCLAAGRGASGEIRIAHPAGIMDVRVTMRDADGAPHVVSATFARTARRIMSGEVWVPEALVPRAALMT